MLILLRTVRIRQDFLFSPEFALYQLKHYADAIAGFETLLAGTDQFPVFQLLSKSYQAVGRRQDAIRTLESYLAKAAPEDPNKATAEAALKELRGDSQR